MRWQVYRPPLALAVLAFFVVGQVSARNGADQTLAPNARAPATAGESGPAVAAASDDPRHYLEFSNTLTSGCMLHRAQQISIANTDPTRAIRVVLWSYTGKTRSQGSSRKTLAPHSEPEPLGCDGESGLDRHWEIESAEFVDAP